MKQINSVNFTGLEQFVVDSTGAYGAYTTIQEAVNAANSFGGGTVYIRKGVYNENITMFANVYLAGVAVEQTSAVTINGTITFTDIAGDCGIQSIYVSASGANPAVNINQTIAVTMNFYVIGCTLGSATGTGMTVTCAAGSVAGTTFANSTISGDAGAISLTGPGNAAMQARYSNFQANTGTAITVGQNCQGFTFFCLINSNNLGTDITDASATFIMVNGFGSFAQEVVTFTAAGTAIVVNCGFSCSSLSGNWAAGAAGTLEYGGISIVGGSFGIAAGLTQVVTEELPRSTAGTSGTAKRGFAGFDSAAFSVSDGFVSLLGTPNTTWNNTTASGGITVNNGYSVSANGVTLTLPATAAFGTTFKVSLQGGTSWMIAQNGGQSIRLGNVTTTVGVGGSLASTAQGDTISCVCDVANTHWFVESVVGNITVV